MGFYDIETRRKLVGIRLTQFQRERLERICSQFGVSHQRLMSDLLDCFCVDYWQAVSGTQTINGAVKESAQKLFDDYINLQQLNGN